VSVHATDPTVTGSATAEPPMRPNKLARILAAVIVSSVTAAIMTRLLGRKAGFVAIVVSASAHEVLEAPLARVLGERLDMRTS
jgi:hypothetical protein